MWTEGGPRASRVGAARQLEELLEELVAVDELELPDALEEAPDGAVVAEELELFEELEELDELLRLSVR